MSNVAARRTHSVIDLVKCDSHGPITYHITARRRQQLVQFSKFCHRNARINAEFDFDLNR